MDFALNEDHRLRWATRDGPTVVLGLEVDALWIVQLDALTDTLFDGAGRKVLNVREATARHRNRPLWAVRQTLRAGEFVATVGGIHVSVARAKQTVDV